MLPLWTDDEKRLIIRAGLDLMQALRDIEKDHRIQNGIDVGRQQRAQTGSDVRYAGLVRGRRHAMGRLYPAPASQAPANVQAWEYKRRLRLQYGDNDFLAWVHAKIAFVDNILDMANAKDAQLVLAYRRMLPAGVIVHS